MGFKLGVIAGFGAGYYLGSKAGRERYEQLNRWAEKAKQTDAYNAAAAKARDLADEGMEKAKDLAVDGLLRARDKTGDDDDSADVGDGPDPDMHLPTQGFSSN